MAEGSELASLDVSRRTVRGRACPVCGGKIIPSNRAVYQATPGADDAYPLWECERCGYEELGVKKAPPPKAAHAAKKPAAKAEE
jgi:DNA-directed RNA polymerase subunit RPC12/RpoP